MEQTRERGKSLLVKKLTSTFESTVENTTDYSTDELVSILSTEIDKGIVNSMVKKYIIDFDKDEYSTRLRKILINLIPNKQVNNPELLKRLINHEITVQELCESMTHRDMFPERYVQADIDLQIEFNNQFGIVKLEDRADGLLQCGKCKSWKTHYYELATRAADESLTVFGSCYKCNHRWRF